MHFSLAFKYLGRYIDICRVQAKLELFSNGSKDRLNDCMVASFYFCRYVYRRSDKPSMKLTIPQPSGTTHWKLGLQMDQNVEKVHSTTTWTKFYPILSTYPLLSGKCIQVTKRGLSTDHLPTSSCPRSYSV